MWSGVCCGGDGPCILDPGSQGWESNALQKLECRNLGSAPRGDSRVTVLPPASVSLLHLRAFLDQGMVPFCTPQPAQLGLPPSPAAPRKVGETPSPSGACEDEWGWGGTAWISGETRGVLNR